MTELNELDRASRDEDRALIAVMMRLLHHASTNRWSVMPTKDEWRSEFTIDWGFTIDLYGDERRIIETIIACDCPCPSECGQTIRRFCTLELES